MDVRNRREHALHGKVQGEEIYVLPSLGYLPSNHEEGFFTNHLPYCPPSGNLKKSTPEDVPDVFCCALGSPSALFDASVHCLDYLAKLK